MNESTILLVVALAVIALMAILIYVASRRRESSAEALAEIRSVLDQILAGCHSIEQALIKQRSVLNDAHKIIHTAVTKVFGKPAP